MSALHRKACLVLATATVTALVGCTNLSEKGRNGPVLSESDRAQFEIESRTPPTYLRMRPASGPKSKAVRFDDAPLYLVLEEAFGRGMQLVPTDQDVNLERRVTVETKPLPESEFLKLLSTLTGYEYTRVNGAIQVASWTNRTWSIPAFAAKFSSEAKISGATGQQAGEGSGFGGGGSGGGGGGGGSGGGSGEEDRGIKAEFKSDLDEWELLIDTVRSIMGADEAQQGATVIDSAGTEVSAGGGRPATRAKVNAMRSVGMIRAYGPVDKINEVDAWLREVSDTSLRQVRLDARLIEVTLSEDKARGVNWSAIVNRTFNGGLSNFDVDVDGDFLPPNIEGAGSLGIGLGVTRPNGDSIESLINLLGRYGEVELVDEPQAQTLNGRTSYIGSGEEFGFVSSVEQTAVQGVIALSPQLQRILIGVELAVTPRVLEDDRILMEVVPVVSTFQGFDNFEIDGSTFSQPRLTLKQLATTVVARSGEPQFLGGLISSRLESEIRGLPLSERKLLGIEKLFEAKSNSVERRELLLVITPTLLD